MGFQAGLTKQRGRRGWGGVVACGLIGLGLILVPLERSDAQQDIRPEHPGTQEVHRDTQDVRHDGKDVRHDTQDAQPDTQDVQTGGSKMQDTPRTSRIDGYALAQQRQCLGCHLIDKRRVGPPFEAVSARFHGQPHAAEYLARVIRQGSRGQWGVIPMPAQSRVNPRDAKLLADWILSLPSPAEPGDP